MMAFILATYFDFIAYMSKMAFFFWKLFFTPMAFLEYGTSYTECAVPVQDQVWCIGIPVIQNVLCLCRIKCGV